ncbi:hypothetical protein IJT10_08730 [bacterium]|nr:hypothetical protein [bacterium]
MSSTLAIYCVVCLIVLTVSAVIFAVSLLLRAHSIDEQLQKIALLMTVMVNLQGATEEDISKAISSEEETSAPASPSVSINKNSNRPEFKKKK